MSRVASWPEELARIVAERRDLPFRWGENDCATFAADVVLALTGRDPAAAHRGYRSEREALSLMRQAGGLRALVDLSEKPAGLARRGDVVLASCEGRETLGIVMGDGHWCAPGAQGLAFRPMNEVLAVYGID